MPIYEYRCSKCGEFEVMQRISEAPLKRCPTCRSKVRKLISSTSFQLKGSGWYVTDYAGKGKPSEKKSESKDTSETKSKTESKTGTSEGSKKKASSAESAAA